MQSLAAISGVALATRSFGHGSFSAPPQMDSMMVANFLLVLVATVCLKEQRHASVFGRGFALSTAALAVLGLLQGEWALGIIVGLWSLASFKQWRRQPILPIETRNSVRAVAASLNRWQCESRVSRLFGSNVSDFENMG